MLLIVSSENATTLDLFECERESYREAWIGTAKDCRRRNQHNRFILMGGTNISLFYKRGMVLLQCVNVEREKQVEQHVSLGTNNRRS